MGEIPGSERVDVSGFAIEDLAPLIHKLGRALRTGNVERVIIENPPYQNTTLTARQAGVMLQALQERWRLEMN